MKFPDPGDHEKNSRRVILELKERLKGTMQGAVIELLYGLARREE
jgi:hypothetical protein